MRLSSHNTRLYRCPSCGAFYRAETLRSDTASENALRAVQREMEQRPADRQRCAPPTYANYYSLRGWPAPHLWLNEYLRCHDLPASVPYDEAFRVAQMLLSYIMRYLPVDGRPFMWDLGAQWQSCTLRHVREDAIADLWQRATDDRHDYEGRESDGPTE